MVKNLTTGNPALLVLSFAMPLFIGNIFQQAYNITDAFIVGRTIGISALAAVGCTGSLGFLIIGFIIGFCSGATVITSQKFGAGDMIGVKKSFTVIIVISIFLAVILTFISVTFARTLLEFLRTPADIIDSAHDYISIIFLGIPITMLFNILSFIMRAVGNSRTPLVFLAISCVINIILDLFFIVILRTGLKGVAFATLLSQLIAAILCIIYINKKMPILRITREDWYLKNVINPEDTLNPVDDLQPAGFLPFNKDDVLKHLKLALPVGFQMSIIAIGTVTITYALNQLGTLALAAFVTASRIDMTATIILSSFGMAMTTYSAQNYGANKPERIRKGIFQVSLIACSYSIVIALIFIFTGTFFPSIFLGKESTDVLLMSHRYLITSSSCYVFLALLFIIRQSLQGLGDSFTPTLAGIMELSMRIFTALFLGSKFGFAGICFANPLAWAGALIPLSIALIIRMKKMKNNSN